MVEVKLHWINIEFCVYFISEFSNVSNIVLINSDNITAKRKTLIPNDKDLL